MTINFVVKGRNPKEQLRAIFAKGTSVPKGRVISIKDINSESTIRFVVKPKKSLKGKIVKNLKTPIERIGRGLLINLILGAVSITIANPAPVLIYQIYKKN